MKSIFTGFCFQVVLHRKGKENTVKVKPFPVTKYPAEALPGHDIIFMVVPAFAHEDYLKVIKNYVKPGTILVGCPGEIVKIRLGH